MPLNVHDGYRYRNYETTNTRARCVVCGQPYNMYIRIFFTQDGHRHQWIDGRHFEEYTTKYRTCIDVDCVNKMIMLCKAYNDIYEDIIGPDDYLDKALFNGNGPV